MWFASLAQSHLGYSQRQLSFINVNHLAFTLLLHYKVTGLILAL